MTRPGLQFIEITVLRIKGHRSTVSQVAVYRSTVSQIEEHHSTVTDKSVSRYNVLYSTVFISDYLDYSKPKWHKFNVLASFLQPKWHILGHFMSWFKI